MNGSQVKEIVESLATSSLSPEELLQRLQSYGIEWYVTEKGDLMIRYWQVGAQDFVPPEHVATIRESQAEPREADKLEWLSRHMRELQVRYPGQWIAVIDDQVVGTAGNLSDLLVQLRINNIEHPFITQIPAGPIIWTTAYAR